MSESRIDRSISQWLNRVNASEAPPDSIVAYNIGLFETAEGGFSAYLIGANRFDPNDGDWACEEAFTPSERYCPIPEGISDDWQGVLHSVSGAVSAYLGSEADRQSFLARAQAITVGFDDGELQRVR